MQLTISNIKNQIKTVGIKKWLAARIEHHLSNLKSPEFAAWAHRKIPLRLRPFFMTVAPMLGHLNYALDWLQPELIRHNFEVHSLDLQKIHFSIEIDPKSQKLKTSVLVLALEAALRTFFEQHLRGGYPTLDLTAVQFSPAPKLIRTDSSASSVAKLCFQIEFQESDLDAALYDLQKKGWGEFSNQAHFTLQQFNSKETSGKVEMTMQLGLNLELDFAKTRSSKNKNSEESK